MPRAEHPPLDDEGGPRWLTAIAALCALALVVGIGLWYARDRVGLFLGEECRATALEQSVSFRPDQMNHASTIVLLGVKRGLPARAGTIAIATAIQESKLRNLSYGDRDSVGLFQQRPSQGWGTEAQLQDPVYATNAFYDALVKVDGWQDMVITEIAQEVQRSGYPEAYADHEQEGRTIASALSGHSPGGLVCRLDGPEAAGRPDRLVAAITEQTGQTATADGQSVTVEATDERHGWAVGAWAVAQAKARNITSVQVGDRVWTRGSGDSAMEWGSADAAPATHVVITLHEG
ncbi:hypothetical protein [Janibacter hoylei]|uniref:hypothetical protein n=1 Tax=Janibacter hoylei TaxID=364298 RepID=UPI0021A908CC|nr:hypothetical protein [Janibacter hoylei]MCT1618839.1 hypothetical protein [Janibacter hoylei]MCT2291653.1 hypothetical protein [Janibacter hoylei]